MLSCFFCILPVCFGDGSLPRRGGLGTGPSGPWGRPSLPSLRGGGRGADRQVLTESRSARQGPGSAPPPESCLSQVCAWVWGALGDPSVGGTEPWDVDHVLTGSHLCGRGRELRRRQGPCLQDPCVSFTPVLPVAEAHVLEQFPTDLGLCMWTMGERLNKYLQKALARLSHTNLPRKVSNHTPSRLLPGICSSGMGGVDPPTCPPSSHLQVDTSAPSPG